MVKIKASGFKKANRITNNHKGNTEFDYFLDMDLPLVS